MFGCGYGYPGSESTAATDIPVLNKPRLRIIRFFRGFGCFSVAFKTVTRALLLSNVLLSAANTAMYDSITGPSILGKFSVEIKFSVVADKD